MIRELAGLRKMARAKVENNNCCDAWRDKSFSFKSEIKAVRGELSENDALRVERR
jgi:hypothetical protein